MGNAGVRMTLEESRMLVDGKLVPASGGRTYDNINPATEKVIGVSADATTDDIKEAIAAARRAFDETSWSTDPAFRASAIRQLAKAMEEDREVLQQVLIQEAGCPVMLTDVIQMDQPLSDFPHWADVAESYPYDTDLPETEFWGAHHRRQVWREPVGVVAAITAWNYPLFLNLAKLGPALAAGCAVVLKPPPDTPWSATHLGRLIAERTDIPPGVVNIVTAADPAAGEVLTTDPRVGVEDVRAGGGLARVADELDLPELTCGVDRALGRLVATRARDDDVHPEGRRADLEEDRPRTRRQVGDDRPRRCQHRRGRTRYRLRHVHAWWAGLRHDLTAAGAPLALRRSGRGRCHRDGEREGR